MHDAGLSPKHAAPEKWAQLVGHNMPYPTEAHNFGSHRAKEQEAQPRTWTFHRMLLAGFGHVASSFCCSGRWREEAAGKALPETRQQLLSLPWQARRRRFGSWCPVRGFFIICYFRANRTRQLPREALLEDLARICWHLIA